MDTTLLSVAIVMTLGITFSVLLSWWLSRRSRAPGRVALPVIQDPHTCGDCKFFDLEAGRALYARQRVFAEMVGPYIAPTEYDSKVTVVGVNAEGIKENVTEIKPRDIPRQCDWNAFGLCLKHNDGFWLGTTSNQRIKNMPDLTAGGVDCYQSRGA